MTPNATTTTAGMYRHFFAASALALFLSLLPAVCRAGLPDALAGWGAAVLQAGAALLINRRAVASRSPYFLAWGLGSMAARMGFLLVLLAGVHATALLQFAPFAIALVASHLILLFAEVARLHVESVALVRTDDAQAGGG